MTLPTAIPSPGRGVWYLGPLPLRAYGILIVCGMVVAVWITSRRYAARGGDPELASTMAMWAIPFGIVGARIYHVLTSPAAYFGPGGNPLQALEIWKGGLGIWGGVALGAVGAWIALRRAGQRMGPMADSVAPALLVAQAIGRWGNWFNQELFGAPTTLPWGLRIDAAHMPAGYPEGTLFHPTFLYECLWNLAMAGLIVLLDRRHRFRSGQVFALYLMAYTLGRGWIEMLRIDDAEHVLGLRLNVWASLLVFLGGLVLFVLAGRRGAPTELTAAERALVVSRDEPDRDGPDAALPAEQEGSEGVIGPTTHGPTSPGAPGDR
ncbi:prolipoprotein diacylglyceryl transferase [Actinomyces provencensis]|uniref:prolipoprotein diacylglyceryl transferase n=1 Tax=Actinomyces provencensis TaxID=1720198 RepID=UPI00096A8525|nr:prolipoprotein diacylglyceryl transferase [Actinomyces provencensis]